VAVGRARLIRQAAEAWWAQAEGSWRCPRRGGQSGPSGSGAPRPRPLGLPVLRARARRLCCSEPGGGGPWVPATRASDPPAGPGRLAGSGTPARGVSFRLDASLGSFRLPWEGNK
jgi:hypothetical protein